MFDSPKELLDKIRLGEDSWLELKEVRFAGAKVVAPARDSLADEIAAFANGKGGVCVLGVDDRSRDVIGIPIERLDRVEEFVRGVLNNSIKPAVVAFIERLQLPSSSGEEKAVIKVDVPRSLFVHQSPSGYFYRSGSSKRQMLPDYLGRLFQQRSQARLIRFDEQTVPAATLNDLESTLWERFRTERSDDDPQTFLRKLGMARPDEDTTWRPTVAGILMATRDPRRWLPNAFIQAVAYRGKEARPGAEGGAYQLDAADISGPIDAQVVDACRFVFKNMRVEATKIIGRRDYPQYHMAAVFEALVNAVAHRDYSMHGSKVRLRLFVDRLELYSPGGLSNTMDIDALAYRQAARNENVTSLLARCPIPSDMDWLRTTRTTFMDRRGEGVGVILSESEEMSGRWPVYRLFDESELLLTVYGASAPVAADDESA